MATVPFGHGPGAAWNRVPPARRDHVLRQAAIILAEPWPLLTAAAHARFSEDGDRETYERPYFARRNRLGAAVITAALVGPTSELIGEIIDGVWLLCEETSWCLLAHDPNGPLPDPAKPYLDLFAAETASLLAWSDLLAGDLIEARAEIVRRRMCDAVRERVLRPYRERDDWWWFGLREKNLNNWTPWIHANLLTASLLDERRGDHLLVAGGSVSVRVRADPRRRVRRRFRRVRRAETSGYGAVPAGQPHLRRLAYQNFADGPPRPIGAVPWLLYRFGKTIGDDQVAGHAIALRDVLPAGAASLIPGLPMPKPR